MVISRVVPTVMESDFAGETAPRLSATVTLKDEVPTAVGVPPITPVDAFSDKPAGSVPLLKVQLL